MFISRLLYQNANVGKYLNVRGNFLVFAFVIQKNRNFCQSLAYMSIFLIIFAAL